MADGEAWAIIWRSRNRDGYQESMVRGADGFPMFFHTRADAREWRQERYGYIKERPDLRAQPHGWLWPDVRKVRWSVQL